MRWPLPTSLFRTLRFRLTLWNSFVVIAVGVSALAALRLGVRYTLIYEADAILREEIEVLSLAIEQLHPDQTAINDELLREVEGHSDHQWFVELLDEHGQSRFRSSNVPAETDGLLAPASSEMRFGQIGNYRIAERRQNSEVVPPFTLRLGTSLSYVDEDVNRLTRSMLPVIVILVVAAPLGGYLLARQATHPIRTIIETTRRLRPSRLKERLPMRGTGDELDQLGDTINRFLDVIAGYVQQHEEFVGNAAHELRSPLTAIRTSVDVALARSREVADYEELLEQVADECLRLEHLVNQLLSLAENDAGTGEAIRLPVAWDLVVQRCLEIFEALAEDRQIELQVELESGVWVLAEENRLRQVVVNLLDNALKFTPQHGRVTVRLRTERERNMALLDIEDTGCGIDPEDLPRLFERFFRAERSRLRQPGVGGTGLGLSICQRIAERFGGKVSVVSPFPSSGPTSSTGTRVTVEWPLAKATGKA